MKKQPDDEILDNLYDRQLQQSEQLKPVLSPCVQDSAQKMRISRPHQTEKHRGPILGTGHS